MKENESEQIFSSTGNLGVAKRQDDRLYVNGTHFAESPAEVAVNYGRLTRIAAEFGDHIGRAVYRGAVSDEVMQMIRETKLQRDLEVALPLEEFTGDSSWLVYLAKNKAGRRPLVSVGEMIDETNQQREVTTTPVERIAGVINRGYDFIDSFTSAQIGQVYDLWHNTFGWNEEEIGNLRHRLERVSGVNPSDRDVWFSAIANNGTIISAAMAERLTIPVNGRSLDLVESTEWRTKDEYAGKHLMTANLTMLNSQILSDHRFSQNGEPLIFAECNYATRSDRAGHGAGMIIPSRDYAQQAIIQNVHVGDGVVSESPYRDFTPLILPMSAIVDGYNQNNVDHMLTFKHAA